MHCQLYVLEHEFLSGAMSGRYVWNDVWYRCLKLCLVERSGTMSGIDVWNYV